MTAPASEEAPLVSIVIPAYNDAAYLAAAIDSVLRQDHPRLEVIVIDDGSTDGTRAVLQGYDGRIRCETQPNMGQAATLNRGWRMAAGDLLGYLSADDVLLPGAISAGVRLLESDPTIVLAYPDYELMDAAGNVLRRVQAPEFDYRRMVLTWVCPPGPGALFRRAAAEAAGPWDPSLRLSPDYDFWLRLGLQGGGRRIPEVLARFRVHEASQSFAAVPPERSQEYVRVTENYFRRQPAPPEVRAARAEAMSNAGLLEARSHLRSGRYRTGVARALSAVRLHPRNARPRTAKILAHGLLHHLRYRQVAAR